MSGTAPSVSIVIATYNWSSVLHYAMASVQRQTFADFELLVIGDGCTDDSGAVAASFRDPRFHWENLPQNHGHQSPANNRGLALARGKWIAYLGHDDLWMPNHLELLLREVEQKEADAAFSLAIVVGAPGCDGRKLFGAFDRGEWVRGAHVPPSALLHRKSLIDTAGGWSDYRLTATSPEAGLLERFFDHGAKFASLPEVTVFKFPSSWRPWSYQNRSCEEQADFFARMPQPGFLRKELTKLALAQELLIPHTRAAKLSREESTLPGAMVTLFRRNRGLTDAAPEIGEPRYDPSPAMARIIQALAGETIREQQASRFALSELFYALAGHYQGSRHTQSIVPAGHWTRLRIPLEYASEGAPLRFDPCDRPARIEIAWIALRREGRVEWSLRGEALAALRAGGDAVVLAKGRTLQLHSTGLDPIILLPEGVTAAPPQVFDCWIKISCEPA